VELFCRNQYCCAIAQKLSQVSLNETGYVDDYTDVITVHSPRAQSKYFVREAAADLSLAPSLQISKDEARRMSSATEEYFDYATNYSSLLSGCSVSI
jgi:hypothetical protein